MGKKSKKRLSRKRHATKALDLGLQTEGDGLKVRMEALEKSIRESEDRLQDSEIHINLLTRLLTTLCIEKFGMRVGVLKRVIRRIEKDALRDSQILHLESLYKLMSADKRESSEPQKPRNDPPKNQL